MVPENQTQELSLDATGTSEAINIKGCRVFALEIVNPATGSPVGTMSVRAANQDVDDNYSELPNGSIAINGAKVTMFNVDDAGYDFVKIFYTKTSGTGTATIVASFKE